MDLDEELTLTIACIEKEFDEVAYGDEDMVEIFKQWDLIVNNTNYTWKDCIIPCLKDTILRLQEKIVIQHKQLHTTTAN